MGPSEDGELGEVVIKVYPEDLYPEMDNMDEVLQMLGMIQDDKQEKSTAETKLMVAIKREEGLSEAQEEINIDNQKEGKVDNPNEPGLLGNLSVPGINKLPLSEPSNGLSSSAPASNKATDKKFKEKKVPFYKLDENDETLSAELRRKVQQSIKCKMYRDRKNNKFKSLEEDRKLLVDLLITMGFTNQQVNQYLSVMK